MKNEYNANMDFINNLGKLYGCYYDKLYTDAKYEYSLDIDDVENQLDTGENVEILRLLSGGMNDCLISDRELRAFYLSLKCLNDFMVQKINTFSTE